MKMTGVFANFIITYLSMNVIATFAQEASQSSSLEEDKKRHPCKYESAFKKLDFWIGEWDVFDVEGKHVGTNIVEKILQDCAILENWVGQSGSKGKSLFYYKPATKEWKQVWVTENVLRLGGLKEKTLAKEFKDGSVRFQGQYPHPNGTTILDRTTLTPLEDGRVRQLIEWSKDGGATWNTAFEGYYVRKQRK